MKENRITAKAAIDEAKQLAATKDARLSMAADDEARQITAELAQHEMDMADLASQRLAIEGMERTLEEIDQQIRAAADNFLPAETVSKLEAARQDKVEEIAEHRKKVAEIEETEKSGKPHWKKEVPGLVKEKERLLSDRYNDDLVIKVLSGDADALKEVSFFLENGTNPVRNIKKEWHKDFDARHFAFEEAIIRRIKEQARYLEGEVEIVIKKIGLADLLEKFNKDDAWRLASLENQAQAVARAPFRDVLATASPEEREKIDDDLARSRTAAYAQFDTGDNGSFSFRWAEEKVEGGSYNGSRCKAKGGFAPRWLKYREITETVSGLKPRESWTVSDFSLGENGGKEDYAKCLREMFQGSADGKQPAQIELLKSRYQAIIDYARKALADLPAKVTRLSELQAELGKFTNFRKQKYRDEIDDILLSIKAETEALVEFRNPRYTQISIADVAVVRARLESIIPGVEEVLESIEKIHKEVANNGTKIKVLDMYARERKRMEDLYTNVQGGILPKGMLPEVEK